MKAHPHDKPPPQIAHNASAGSSSPVDPHSPHQHGGDEPTSPDRELSPSTADAAHTAARCYSSDSRGVTPAAANPSATTSAGKRGSPPPADAAAAAAATELWTHPTSWSMANGRWGDATQFHTDGPVAPPMGCESARHWKIYPHGSRPVPMASIPSGSQWWHGYLLGWLLLGSGEHDSPTPACATHAPIHSTPPEPPDAPATLNVRGSTSTAPPTAASCDRFPTGQPEFCLRSSRRLSTWFEG